MINPIIHDHFILLDDSYLTQRSVCDYQKWQDSTEGLIMDIRLDLGRFNEYLAHIMIIYSPGVYIFPTASRCWENIYLMAQH